MGRELCFDKSDDMFTGCAPGRGRKENKYMQEELFLEECPICRGAGLLMHEGGWNVQVECADCSAHTVYVEYSNEAEKAEAEKTVVHLWNIGKVISSERGE